MNAPFKQDARLGRLTTALGPDALVLLRFDGTDHINGLFDYRVEALSPTRDIDFDALMGTHASVQITSPGHGPRHFDGIVTQARWLGVAENGHRFDLALRPWFWLAGRRRNQRIFHNMSVVKILEELLAPYGGLGNPALKNALVAEYPDLEYTVQYRETDLDFACRQMERFGISYHFTHAPGSHTLVLTDAADAHDPVAGGTRAFREVDGHHNSGEEHFWEMAAERNLTTGAVRLTDYNFKLPTAAMETDSLGDATHDQGQIESFDYPGDYPDQGRGKSVAGLRTAQERGGDRRHRASGDCISLGAGMTVTLGGDPVPGIGAEPCLCLSATQSFVSEGYGSGANSGGEYAFSGSYVLMPVSAPLAPPKRTAVPVVQGPQTAVVVGDGEIDCDEFGRILVRFHWDLAGANSMRCRVSQNWAGKGWGGVMIPRIGMEVVVEFLEGDPDKPLVTGCVYNGKNDAPYPLPAHKTKSVLRSNTHEGKGFNEIAFEDQAGEENISLHAQKDQTLKVLHNRAKRVDNDQIESVGRHKSVEVGGNHQEKIGGSMNLSVGSAKNGALFAALGNIVGQAASRMQEGAAEVGDKTVSAFVGGLAEASAASELLSLGGIAKFAAAGGNAAIAGAAQAGAGAALGQLLGSVMPVSGISNTIIEKAKSETVGLASTEQVGLFKNTVVGMVQTTYVGKKKIIDVGEELVIQVGKSKLVMKKDGTIRLLGDNLNISMSGPVQINGSVIDLN